MLYILREIIACSKMLENNIKRLRNYQNSDFVDENYVNASAKWPGYIPITVVRPTMINRKRVKVNLHISKTIKMNTILPIS